MTTQEINDAICLLNEHCKMREDVFIENGGEITEETEELEQNINALKELLMGDGVDSLGRWLKSLEDSKSTLKDEKAKIDRMIKASENSVEYVKSLINKVLAACEIENAAGLLYSFSRSVSITHSANTELINERYLEKAGKAVREAGLPSWIGVSLKASYTLVPDGVKTDEFTETVTPTVRFNKPKKMKENA